MRIAFIVGYFPTLTETFILNQIIGVINKGHYIKIFATRPKKIDKVHDDVMKYNLLDRTSYRILPKNKIAQFLKGMLLFTKYIFLYPRPMLKAINFFKYGKYVLTFNPVYDFAYFRKEKEKFDIIHCQFGPAGFRGQYLKEVGILEGKLVVSFRGHDISSFVAKYGKTIYKNLFREADLFLPVCSYFKKKLILLGCDEKKIIVHRSGIDYKTFARKKRKNINTIRIISVSRLIEKKGITYAIRAFHRLLDANKDIAVEYIIVGEGYLRNSIEALIKELKLEHETKLLGWQTKEEVKKLLQNSDIMLAPSITDKNGEEEGIPNVIKEAMALGIPVISTYHSGIPELIKDNESGFLVPEKDVDALYNKLNYLIRNKDIWDVVGETAKKVIIRYYDNNRLNDQLISLYNSLLGQG